MTITPNKILYTVGFKDLPDGTQVIVGNNHNGGDVVTCISGDKATHFIFTNQLTDVKPVAKSTIPNYLKPLGTSIVYPGKCVFVFNHPTIADNSIYYISEGYVHNTILTDIRLTRKNVVPNEHITIDKCFVYHQPAYTNPVQSRVIKPLASASTVLTEDHKYMIELLKEPNRNILISKVLDGVDLDDYEVIQALKYYVLVPKEPESLYLPMIMAHTDIVTSVKHPTDANLEYDERLDKFTSPTGLGADDRAGCYAINRILKKHPKKFIIALFDEEEIGCVGSKAFSLSPSFEKVNQLASCYISIDRRRGFNGAHQIATYGYNNQKLFDAIRLATGRLTVQGSSTDCRTLAERSYNLPHKAGQSKLACFNMSCGYEDEHRATESLYFTELQKVVEDFDAIVDLAPELWDEPFEAIKPTTTTVVTKGKGKGKHYTDTNLWGVEELMVDNELFDENDIRTLIWYYKQTSGKTYKFSDSNKMCKEFDKDNYVRLDNTCSVGGVFGGVVLSQDLHTTLAKHTWVVNRSSEKNMTCDLLSADGLATASNIPYAWLKLVLVGDALVEVN